MIDFHLDEDQQLIEETVVSFARDRVRPAAHEADETETIPTDLVEEAWGLGLAQATVPESCGGFGQPGSAVTGAVIAEKLAEGDLAIALHVLSPRLVIDPVVLLGNEEQQKEILPAYCGDSFAAGSAAVMEPRWDANIDHMRCSAVLDGDEYVINGEKCQVPLANSAPWIIVYASDGETVAALAVRQGTPGMEVGEREKNMGVKALETHAVKFNDCRVPASARLGTDASPMLRRARVAQSAMAVGVGKASLDYAIEYAKEREAFGVKIGQKQAIAFMLAEMAIEVDASRLLNWEAAWKIDQNEDATREVAMARRYAADAVMMVTDNGIQVLGGHGFIREHPVELWARNGRGFAVFEGLASV
ncbi:MAG: acyl-CoA dehydrogenase family protein [Candidatus Binatia bacterium]